MKKMLSLLLAAVLVLACVGVSAADDVTGTWYLTSVSQGDVAMDPAMLGMEITMVLNADGTVSMNALGQAATGTWSMDDLNVTIVVEDSPQTFTYDGVSLTAAMDGVSMKFERSSGETYTRPANVIAENMSQFDGSWTAVKACVGGMYMDMSMLAAAGLDLGVDVLIFGIENGVLTAPNTDPLELTFADGVLSSEIPGLGDEPTAIRVLLLEGDTIEIEIPAVGFSFICERTEAAQQAA